MNWLTFSRINKYNVYTASSTSTAGLLFRRSQLSWLYLFGYSQIFIGFSLAFLVGEIGSFFTIASLIWFGILTPIFFVCILCFFLLGLFGFSNVISSFLLLILPEGLPVLICKVGMVLFCFQFLFFVFRLLFRLFFVAIEHSIRFFFFSLYCLIFFVFYFLKHEPIIYFLYHFLLEICAWIYVVGLFLWLRLTNHTIIVFCINHINKIYIYFLSYVFINLCKLPSFGGISRYLQIKLKTFFLFYLLNSGKTDLAYLTEHKQTVLDSLKITPKQLVFHRLSSQEKRKSRRKARNLAKLYCDVKYRKIRTVDDVYKHFL